MNIDNKLPLFRSFLSDPKLNFGDSKTSLGQSSVTSTEQKSVNLELFLDEDKKASLKKEKNKKRETTEQTVNKVLKQDASKQNKEKKIDLKLLNLL